jgi:hypothetical protein
MEGDGVYNGHAEIWGWYEPLLLTKSVTTLSECSVDGETVTCLDTYADEGLKSMGVDFIEGIFVAVVRDSKIQSYTVSITPESLAKFPPAPTEGSVQEVRLTTPEALVGNWKGQSGGYMVLHQFKADGTMVVNVSGVGVIGTGPYLFENDLLKFEDTTGDCEGVIGKYEVYGTYEGEQLTQLRFVLVGDDPCSDRRKTLDGNIMVPAN